MTRRIIEAALVVTIAALGAQAQPANDECAAATVITSLPFTDTLDASTATSDPGDPLLPCRGGLPIGTASVWYIYTAAEPTVLDIDTRTSTYSTTVAVWGGGCGIFERLACSSYNLEAGGTAEDFHGRTFVTIEAGDTVHIEVATTALAGATLNLTVQNAPGGHPAPLGPEFLVNITENDSEGGAYYKNSIDACRSPNGDFVVVWETPLRFGDADIRARRFAADGTPFGAEFQVNTYTTDPQFRPSVACGPTGGFVVAWQDYEPAARVKAQLFDDTGAPTGGEIVVSPSGGSPTVGMDASGAFVVAWYGDDVHSRRFDAGGTPTTGDTVLGLDGESPPDIDVADDGRAVVVWQGAGESGRARRLDAVGAPVGGEIVVAEGPTDYVDTPAVSINATGSFVVVWHGDSGYGFDPVRARSFSPMGTPGPPQTVSTFEDFNVIDTDVALDAAGNFVVTWSDFYETEDVLARRVRADGTLIGDVEMTIPVVSGGWEGAAHVTDAVAGEFVVAWVGEDGEIDSPTSGYFGGGYGVRAQRFTFAPTIGTVCPTFAADGCKQPVVDFKGKLKIKDKDEDTKDVLLWKWVNGEEVLVGDLGSPLGADGFALCLYAPTLFTEAFVPSGGVCDGKPCWKAINNGFLFKDKAAANGGVKKLLVKAGDAGKAKLVVKAKGASLPTPPLPLTLPATMQLHGTSGTCWSAEFHFAGVQKNTPDAFGGLAQPSP